MKTPKQANIRGFIFRRLKPITQAIALAQSPALILAALVASALAGPVTAATNPPPGEGEP